MLFVAAAAAIAVTLSAAGAAMPRAVAARPTLVVVVLGSGHVASKPAGISCPGACRATFAARTSVVLTAKPRNGSRFLRWGGSCTGARTCRVRVSSLAAVAAEFVAGSKTKPKPAPQKTVAEPGSYSGGTLQGSTLTFFVPAGGASMVNISIPRVVIACTPPGPFPTVDHLEISKTAIKRNGSFTAKTTQNGVFAGVRAKFTYSFAGRLQRATAAGAATAAGTFREDIVFTDSATHRCTSNNQSWKATRTRDPQPSKKTVVEPGNYSGGTLQGSALTFSVSAGGASMVNISIPRVVIACTPPGPFPTVDHLEISKTAIKQDGSFTAKASQDGVFAGVKAKFTYFFNGHFQGVNAAGTATAAGSFREDIVFTDSTTHTCTSNNQSWTAARLR